MTRTQLKNVVADLSRELGHSPSLEMIAARFSETPSRMKAFLQALVTEGALEADGASFRVSQNIHQVVTIPQPQKQPELFTQPGENGDGEPAADSAAHLTADERKLSAEELDSLASLAKSAESIRPTSVGMTETDEKALAEPTKPDRLPVGRWQIAVIRIVMAASGVGASIVSGYFAISRLAEFMPRGLAAILGAFIVAFAVIAFELVLVFVQRKSYFAAATFVFLWALVAIFTLNATVAGFYTFYTSVKHEATVREAPESANKNALDSFVSEETVLQARVAVVTSDLQANERTVQNTTTSAADRSDYGRVFYDAQARIVADSKALDDLQNRLQVVREKERAILAASPAVAAALKRVDYFEWAGGMLHWQAATMELVSAIFPSVFIDLISSIGLAVALFLSSQRKA